MNKISLLKKGIEFNSRKDVSVSLFIVFISINLFYFINNFFLFFFNKKSNGDEYYFHNLYTVTSFSAKNIFYTPSQPFILLSSCIDYFLKHPMISTRIVSLIACVGLIYFFTKKIKAIQSSSFEKVLKITLFCCAILITNQMFIGTSDFLSVVLLVPALLFILESIDLGKINLTPKSAFVIGIFFAFSIASRPTAIILIGLFYFSIFILLGFKSVFCIDNFIMLLSGAFFLLLINFLPAIQEQKIILDVKEVPKETGVNWFQRNYLMAKFWDSNQIPNTQWVSTNEVIEFKKQNPNYDFPKNQIDLLLKEPGLYFRQMIRMFVKAMYTSYRFMYLLFPILFLSLLKNKRFKTISLINQKNTNNVVKNKIIIVFHLSSIIVFSFLAVKLFEFRWVIPVMILYTYYAIRYLTKLPEKARFLIYNLSFISGIILFVLFFVKNGLKII